MLSTESGEDHQRLACTAFNLPSRIDAGSGQNVTDFGDGRERGSASHLPIGS